MLKMCLVFSKSEPQYAYRFMLIKNMYRTNLDTVKVVIPSIAIYYRYVV